MPRPSGRRGVTLLEVLIAILVLVLILTAASQCYLATRPPSWYTVPTANRQKPVVSITPGATRIGVGKEATFTVKVTYANAISSTYGWFVVVSVFENDTWPYGDMQLIRRVPVQFPPGATSGTAIFDLTCVDPGTGILIQGADGSDTFEDPWQVYARVEDQQASLAEDSGDVEVRCTAD